MWLTKALYRMKHYSVCQPEISYSPGTGSNSLKKALTVLFMTTYNSKKALKATKKGQVRKSKSAAAVCISIYFMCMILGEKILSAK